MILHCIPAGLRGRYGAGNWKDFEAFEQLLSSGGWRFKTLEVHEGTDWHSLVVAEQEISDVLIHYTRWPKLLSSCREQFPRARLHVRAHNAEAFQTWQRAGKSRRSPYGLVRALYASATALRNDGRCRRIADDLLGISAWDNDHYWVRLPGRARIHHVPYHSPWPRMPNRSTPRPWADRRSSVVCMPGGGMDPLALSQREGFQELASRLVVQRALAGWQFEMTRGVFESGKTLTSRPPVRILENVPEPWELLCTVRAVAVLTHLGFGFKTTIVDALAAGCHVLVDDRLAKRLPDNVRQACELVNLRDEATPYRLAVRLSEEPRAHDLNGELRREALHQLKSVFVASSLRGADAPL